jgi:hypothetical protein
LCRIWLSTYKVAARRDLAEEVADHKLDAVGHARRGQERGRLGQRLGAVHQHAAGGREGPEQVGQERPAAAAHIDDAPRGQRPETGLGELVHQDPGDQPHGPDEPGRLLPVLAEVLVDTARSGRAFSGTAFPGATLSDTAGLPRQVNGKAPKWTRRTFRAQVHTPRSGL